MTSTIRLSDRTPQEEGFGRTSERLSAMTGANSTSTDVQTTSAHSRTPSNLRTIGTTQSNSDLSSHSTDAAALLERGFFLTPLHYPISHDLCSCERPGCKDVGKHPRLAEWDRNSSNHPKRVQLWMKKYPQCNFGVACGPSGLLVIDEDVPGEFDRFCVDHGFNLPETFRVNTAKGQHFYFSQAHLVSPLPNSNAFRAIGYDVDVRGVGGQVVAAGSMHRSGVVYTAPNDLDVQELPEFLEELLKPKRATSLPTTPHTQMVGESRGFSAQYLKSALDDEMRKIRDSPNGQHNSQINTSTYRLAQLPISDDRIYEEVTAAGLTLGHDGSRIRKTIASALAAGREQPRKAPNAMTTSTSTSTTAGSSWAPLDLASILDGSSSPPEPCWLARTDGVKLLYPAAMHSIYGEPESGKSWVFLAVAKEVLDSGGQVLFFDFESDPTRIVERLRLLGVSEAALKEGRFAYVQPEEEIDGNTFAELLRREWDLVGIDGVIQCLATTGYKDEAGDVARWFKDFPRKFSRNGASVLMMDHVTKSNNGASRFAIGSMYKLGAIDGASFEIDTIKPFGKGLVGEASIRVTKDRNGSLRQHGDGFHKSDRKQEIGRLRVDATSGSCVAVALHPPGDIQTEDRTENLIRLMWECSKYIEQNPECNKSAVYREVSGKQTAISSALDELESSGYVKSKKRGRAEKYFSLKSYRQNSGASE